MKVVFEGKGYDQVQPAELTISQDGDGLELMIEVHDVHDRSGDVAQEAIVRLSKEESAALVRHLMRTLFPDSASATK